MVRVEKLQNDFSISKIFTDVAGLSNMDKIIKSSINDDIIIMQYATYNRSLHNKFSKIEI